MKRVIVRHVPEPATQRLLLEKGDIDIALSLLPDQLAPLAEQQGHQDRVLPRRRHLVPRHEPGRRAAEEPEGPPGAENLVDYQGMVNTFLKGRFIVQQTFLPIGFLGAIPYNPYKLDVAKAKALLAEAGYPNGFELELTVPNTAALDRYRPVGAADHGPGRHQGEHRAGRAEAGAAGVPRAASTRWC